MLSRLFAKFIATNGALTMALHPWCDAVLMEHVVAWGYHYLLSCLKIIQANSTPFTFFICLFSQLIQRIFAQSVSVIQAHSP
ncbi:hypothetical protein ACB092_06G169100 [Castanea dentata]